MIKIFRAVFVVVGIYLYIRKKTFPEQKNGFIHGKTKWIPVGLKSCTKAKYDRNGAHY